MAFFPQMPCGTHYAKSRLHAMKMAERHDRRVSVVRRDVGDIAHAAGTGTVHHIGDRPATEA